MERDEPLFEISTDKVDTEIPSPAAGVLGEVLVQEGQTVQVNAVVARISEGAEWRVRRPQRRLRRTGSLLPAAAAAAAPPAPAPRRSRCPPRTRGRRSAAAAAPRRGSE